MEQRRCSSGPALIAAAILLVSSLCVSPGSAQVDCYIGPGCFSVDLLSNEPTIRDCCLGQRNGTHYTSSGGPCTECIVYGFDIPGQPLSESSTFIAEESSSEQYSLPIRMIKGRVGSLVLITAEVLPGATADEGQGADFFIDDKNFRVRPTTELALQVTFRVDSVALEPDESFQVTLSSNPAPPAGSFFLNNVDMTIQDPDEIEIKFSESDYSVNERSGEITALVQTEGRRATNVTVRVTPLNYDDFLSLGVAFPSDFPTVPPLIANSPNRATTDRDFSSVAHDLTFPVTDSAQTEPESVTITLTDDEINEGGEVFVVMLELVDAVDASRIDLSVRNVSLCRIGDNDPIEIGFQFPSYTYSEADGFISSMDNPDVVPIFLNKSRDSEQTFEVIVRASTGGFSGGVGNAEHGDGGDYIIGTTEIQTFDFEPGQNSIELLMRIRQDDLPEGREAARLVSLQVEGSVADFNPGPNPNTIINIDDDGDLVIISLTPETFEVREDVGTVEFTLTVKTPEPDVRLPLQVFVNLETVNGSAGEDDYVPITVFNSPLDMPFDENTREMKFTVTINDDDLFELTEMFTIMVSPEDPAIVEIQPNVGRITILDNDEITIGFNETEVTVGENAGFAPLTVAVLDGELGTAVTVGLSTVDGSARDTFEFTAIFGQQLEFTSSQLSRRVDVQIIDDNVLEILLKRFQANLVLSGPTLVTRPDAITIAPNVADITIRDDDEVVIGFDRVVYNITEDGGFVELSMRILAGRLGKGATVRFNTMDGTAVAGQDYDAVTQDLEFHVSSAFTVTVPITNDTLVETTENFFGVLTLISTEPDGIIINPGRATVNIFDQDNVIIGFSLGTYNVSESAGFVRVTVMVREGQLDRDVFVTLQTANGSAVSTGPEPDYTHRSVILQFNQAVTVLTVDILITNDTFLEYDESLRALATLTTVEDRITLDPDRANINILNDDFVVVGFDQLSYQIEHGVGPVTLTIRINIIGQLRRDIRVRFFTREDTAIDGDDYLGQDQMLTFTEGDTGRDINITILGDTVVEPTEVFFGELETSDPDVRLDPATTEVQITDSAAVLFTFRQPEYTFSEGVVTGVVYVDKFGATIKDFSVRVSGALQPELGRTLSEVLVFAANESAKRVEFEIADDTIALEPDQLLTFTLELISTTGAELGNHSTTSITIEDDDLLMLGLDIAAVFPEDAGTAQAFITFSTGFATGFNIIISTLEAHSIYPLATANADYGQLSNFLFFAEDTSVDPSLRRAVNIAITDDERVEELREGFTVEIGFPPAPPPPAALSIVGGTQESAIEDNDVVTIGFDPVTVSVVETMLVLEFNVSILDGFLDRSVEVTFSTLDGTALAGLDFRDPGEVTLQFDSTATSQIVRITIIDDAILEADENFFGRLNTTDAAVTVDPSEAEATIVEDNDEVTIGFRPTDYSALESQGTVDLTIEVISGTLDRNVEINFSTQDGTAIGGVDFTMTPLGGVVVQFSPSQLSVDVPVTILDDNIVEANENFFGRLTNPVGDPVILNPDRATVTINDTGDAVTIGFEQITYTTEEGTTVEVCAVIVSGTLEREAVVTLTSRDGSAEVGTDYTAVSSDLVFSETVSRVCRNVSTEEDDILEGDEEFLLDLTTSDPSVQLNPNVATVTIADDGDSVTIGLEETTFTVDEGELVEVCVILISGTLEREVTVTLTTSDGTATATAPADYTAVTVPLVFDSTTSRVCVNISTLDDSIYEDSEVFDVNVNTGDPNVIVAPDTGEITIRDVDVVTIGFERTMDFADEIDGFVMVCAEVKPGSTLETQVVVNFNTADGSAIAPDDYGATTESFTFSPSILRVCTNISIVDDVSLEGSETFEGRLTTSADRVTLNPDQTSITIVDDDVITIGFRQVIYNAGEADGSVTLFVEVRFGVLDDDVDVRLYTGDDTAGAPADYASLDTILRFSSTVTEHAIPVTIQDDDLDEINERFLGFLRNVTFNPSVSISPDQATINIIDDDNVTIGLEDPEIVVDEDDGTVQVCVRILEGELDREITVTLSTMDVTAIAPEDYVGLTVDLIFNSGVNRSCVDIDINDNPEFEGNETFYVILETTDPETTLDPAHGTIEIVDDDPLVIGLGLADYIIPESDGPLEVCLEVKSGNAIQTKLPTFTLRYDDLEAVDGLDYLENTASLEFGIGDSQVCLNITIIDDNAIEEQFERLKLFINLLVTDPAVQERVSRITLAPNNATVTIVDDDSVVIGFERTSYSVNEEDGVVSVTVLVISGRLEKDIDVRLFTTDDSAVSPDDYSSVDTTLRFSGSVISITMDFNITSDTIDELPESFFADLELVTSRDNVTIFPSRAAITIIDDDEVRIGLEETEFTVDEEEVIVQVCARILSGSLGRDADVTFQTVDGSAEAPSDYDSVTMTFTFNDVDTRHCINVSIHNDSIIEGLRENLTVILTTTDGKVILDPDTGTIVILETDFVRVRFVQPSYTFTENGIVGTIGVERVGRFDEDFNVIVQGGPSQQTDIVASGAAVNETDTFTVGGNTIISIDIALTNDDVALEAVEQYILSLSLPAGTTGIEVLPSEATTTINILDDNDVTVGFGRPDLTVSESQGYFTMCVLKDADTVGPVTVNIESTDRSATAGQDYLPATIPSQITFGQTDRRFCFNGTIVDDDIAAEFLEDFVLTITSVSPSGVMIGTQDTVITIVDEDEVTVRFEEPEYSVNEGDVAEVCLLKDSETPGPLTVNVPTAEDSATDPEDYRGGVFPVTFPSGPNQKVCINIQTVLDTVVEITEESFTASIDILPGSGATTGNPNMTRVFISGVGVQVNDTIIGDPLLTVPINVVNRDEFGLDPLSLCYEIHGEKDVNLSFVTDNCLSVNAHYREVSQYLNIIDRIGIRAVDMDSVCRNIEIQIDNCTVLIDGVQLPDAYRFEDAGIHVRRARRGDRVRVSVPNCNDLSVVMYTVCQRERELEDPADGTVVADMLKFEVTRGLNFGHSDSHGLLGQFWNRDVELKNFTGDLNPDYTPQPYPRYTLNVNDKNFTGILYGLTWEFKDGPCLYAGNRQAGPIAEVDRPDDPVIDGLYSEYKVDGLFTTTYKYGRFDEGMCGTGSGTPFTQLG